MLDRWITDLGSGDARVRYQALVELRALGADAGPAVPALVVALQRAAGEPITDALRAIVWTLGALGTEARSAVPALVAALDCGPGDPNRNALREDIARVLLALGSEAASAVPALLAVMEEVRNDPDAQTLRAALDDALVALGSGPRSDAQREDARQVIRNCLMAEPFLHWKAYEPVNRLWIDADPMRERANEVGLADLLTDPEDACRSLAAGALAEYGCAARAHVPALIAALNEPDSGVRIGVACALAALEPARKPEAIAALRPLLANPALTESISSTLRQLGFDVVPPLLALLRRTNGKDQLSAVRALRNNGEASIGPLLGELTNTSVAGRRGAARALGLFDSEARGAFEPLLAALNDADAEARGYAAQALVRIDAARSSMAVPHLLAALGSADADIRAGAANMLTRLAQVGSRADSAVPTLHGLLTDSEMRLEAALALVAIDASAATDAVPVLVEALERSKPLEGSEYDADPPARAIVEALGRIGSPATVAVPLIHQALPARNRHIRAVAAVALTRLSPELTTEATRTLVNGLRDSVNGMMYEGLAVLGVAAVPELMAALEESQHQRSGTFTEALLVALGRLGPGAAASVPLVRQTLRAATGGERVLAATALVRVAPDCLPEALTTLGAAVGDEDPAVMFAALEALSEIGPPAGSPAVVKAVEAVVFNEDVRRCYYDPALGCSTLVKIDPAASARVAARIEADLASPEHFERDLNLVLDVAGVIPARAAPLLAQLLKDARAEGQRAAVIQALRDLGAAAAQ